MCIGTGMGAAALIEREWSMDTLSKAKDLNDDVFLDLSYI